MQFNAPPAGRYVHPHAAGGVDEAEDHGINLDVAEDSAPNHLQGVADLVASYLGERVLDMGAGIGAITERFATGRHVVACDISDEFVAALHQRFDGVDNVDVVRADLRTWEPEERFDSVVMINVLEHIEDDVETIRSLGRLLVPGGSVVIYVPALNGLFGDFDRKVGHFRRYSKWRLGEVLREAGLDVEALRYANMIAIPGWLAFTHTSSDMSGGRTLPVWDRYVLPVSQALESRVPVPLGTNLLGVGRVPVQPEEGADDWDRHWDEFSAANKSNPAQTYRRSLALSLVERRESPRRVLDVGSGQGDFLLGASERWPDAMLAGLEISEQGVREARARVPSATVLRRDLLDGSEPSEAMQDWATHAVCSEVLEHVDDDVALLRAARDYLAPGCRLVVTVPGGQMSAFDRHIGHRRHYTPESLAETLRSAGLDVAFAVKAGFPFFNLYRALVIARGERLVDDATAGGNRPSALIRAGMAVFGLLFKLNLPRSPWGAQVVAVAYEPGAR